MQAAFARSLKFQAHSSVTIPARYGKSGFASRADAHAASISKLANVWKARSSDIIVEKAEGSYIYGTDGNKYLDFSCGIAVTNTGHCHPHVVKAIQQQAGKLLHGQANIVYHQPMLDLVEKLGKVVKVSDSDNYFFANSGAEAIEASMKLARQVSHKQNIIAFTGSFHGRTMGTMPISNSKYIYRIGFGPMMGGALNSSFAYCLHCNCPKAANSDCCGSPLEQLELVLKQQSHPSDTAAVIMEPVLGEGGYVVPPKSFVKGVREICDKNNILLIFDEVQTGVGRTGKMFAFEHFDVKPDILVLAKGIASGLPLSGVIARSELMSQWKPGSHGGTYGGNAVACAAANATLEVFENEKILENVNKRGAELRDALKALQKKYPLIKDVRGLGLMIGVEFDHKKAPGIAAQMCKAALSHKMLLLSAGVYEVLRVIPPLNISKEDMAAGIRVLEQCCRDVMGAPKS